MSFYISFPDICTCGSLSSVANSSILPESGGESEINSVRVESCIGIAGPCVCDSSSCAVRKFI